MAEFTNQLQSDLKSFYPVKKSSNCFPGKKDGPKKEEDKLIHVDTCDTVITIDLSDDSLLVDPLSHRDQDKDDDSDDSLLVNPLALNQEKDADGDDTLTINPLDDNFDDYEYPLGELSSDEKDSNSLGDDLGNFKANNDEDIMKTEKKETPVKYNFDLSDDDDFLDIPLSQRLGLNRKNEIPILLRTPAEELDIVLDNKEEQISPAKKNETVTKAKKDVAINKKICTEGASDASSRKIEKRRYQSDTPPSKQSSYTHMKEKNSRNDVIKDLPEDDEYRIEETITPARTRRSPEEIMRLQTEKEKKKAQRIEERLVKAKMKAKEKERSKALKEAGKAKQISECHRFCKTYLDEKLVDFYKIKDELAAIFKEKEAPLILESNPSIEFGLRWKREARDLVEEGSEDEVAINVVRKEVEGDHIMKVLHSSDYIPLTHASVQQISNCGGDLLDDGSDESKTLFDFVTDLLDEYEKNLTLVLYGFEKYCNQQKNRENQEYRAQLGLGKKSNKAKDSIPLVKKSDMELALFDLQVKLSESSYSSRRVHIIFTENTADLCSTIWSHTRSTAIAHIKHAQRDQIGLEWYAQNDAHGCVDIQTETDITSLWTKQLMSFSKMSMEMAKAISNVYPSPQALLTAYSECDNDEDRAELLTSIEVSRDNYGKGTTEKKLGSLASRKISLFLTTRDGDAIID